MPSWTVLTGSAFGASDVDAVVHAASSIGNPEALPIVPLNGQSRSPRKGPIGSDGVPPLDRPGDGRLQVLLCREQLAGQLGVQIAALIDFAESSSCAPPSTRSASSRARYGLRPERRQLGLMFGDDLA